MSENAGIILAGCGLIVLGSVYTGTYKGRHGRGKPDYPATRQGRITLWACGALFICVGLIRIVRGY
jgi:hypothetical protein